MRRALLKRVRRGPSPALLSSLAGVLAIAIPTVAFARPGGGESYGGGSSGDGGGGGGGGSVGLLIDLIIFTIHHPILGGIIFLVLGVVYFGNHLNGGRDFDVGQARSVGRAAAATTAVATRRSLDALRANDPAWSTIVFEEFLHLLYAEMQRSRGRGEGARMGPYANDAMRATLSSDATLDRVEGIVIGAASLLSLQRVGGEDDGCDTCDG